VSLQLGPWAPEALLPVIEALLPRQIFVFSFFKLSLFTLAAGGNSDRPEGALC